MLIIKKGILIILIRLLNMSLLAYSPELSISLVRILGSVSIVIGSKGGVLLLSNIFFLSLSVNH